MAGKRRTDDAEAPHRLFIPSPMWFWRSFTYLSPLTLEWVALTTTFLGVFLVIGDFETQVFGLQIFALKAAMLAAVCVDMPWAYKRFDTKVKDKEPFVRNAVLTLFAISVLVVLAMPSVTALQYATLFAYGLVSFLFALVNYITDDADLLTFEYGWVSDPTYGRIAVILYALRFAVLCLAGTLVIASGVLIDWVLFLVVVPKLSGYLVEWILVLLVMTAPEDD